MNQWFVAKELAGIECMPTTERRTRDLLEKLAEGKPEQKRKRQGTRGFEYHISLLPQQTQSVLTNQGNTDAEQEILPQQDPAQEVIQQQQEQKTQKRISAEKSLQQLSALPEDKRQLVDAKLAIIAALAAFLDSKEAPAKKVQAIDLFCQRYNGDQLNTESWVKQQVKQVSAISLRRWQKTVESEGAAALAGRYKSKAESKIDTCPQVADFILALITAKPHMLNKSREIAKLIEVKKKHNYPHWPTVSASSVQRHLNKVKNQFVTELAYATNPKDYNNSHRPLFGKMYAWVSKPNQVWELDSTPTDVQLNVNGKARRYSLIGAIDVFTRRLMLVLMPTSNSEGICLLLRKCILTWGIPEPDSLIRTDNGSDYVSQRTTGLFSMLELNQSKAKAFSGWEKPFIERAFKTISHGLMEKMPGYIGHNVADKKRLQEMMSFAESIGSKRKEKEQQLLQLSLTPQELQQMLDDHINFDYNHREHQGLAGKTPFQVYTESGYRPQVPENPHSLDLLLSFAGTATVIRGGVKAGSIRYTSPELMEAGWDRKQVRVFIDPTDVGRATLYPADHFGSYVEAVNMDLIGRDIDPAQYRERRNATSKALRAFKRTAQQLQKDFGIDELAAVELAQKKAENQCITSFNQPQVSNENEALAALSKSATSLVNSGKASTYTEAELEAIEARRKELDRRKEVADRQNAALNEQNQKVLRTEHEQAEWLTRQSLERELTVKESNWLTQFRTANYLTRKRLDRILEEGKRANG